MNTVNQAQYAQLKAKASLTPEEQAQVTAYDSAHADQAERDDRVVEPQTR